MLSFPYYSHRKAILCCGEFPILKCSTGPWTHQSTPCARLELRSHFISQSFLQTKKENNEHGKICLKRLIVLEAQKALITMVSKNSNCRPFLHFVSMSYLNKRNAALITVVSKNSTCRPFLHFVSMSYL